MKQRKPSSAFIAFTLVVIYACAAAFAWVMTQPVAIEEAPKAQTQELSHKGRTQRVKGCETVLHGRTSCPLV